MDKTNIKVKDEEVKKEAKNLFLIIAGIVIIFVVFILLTRTPSFSKEEAMTLDQLHRQNYINSPNNETMYMYNDHSIIYYNSVWNTQLRGGETLYDVTFNHGPKDVEDIEIIGELSEEFIKTDQFYITFDPEGKDLKHIAVANYGLSSGLAIAFRLPLKAGCTKNTAGCENQLLITCDDKNKSIFFFKEDNETKIIYDDNCVIIQGSANEIIRAKDKLLYTWYGIIRN